jgi:hypothetical protein
MESRRRAPREVPDISVLDEDAREFFEERAAIIEFDGGLCRPQAEALALSETQRYMQRRKHQT